MALCAVEDAFKFVPENDPELEKGSVWSKALGDPRYSTEVWESSSAMTKYDLLLPHAKNIIAAMKHRSLHAPPSDWMLDVEELKAPLDEPRPSWRTPEQHATRTAELRGVIHLWEHHFYRYEIVVKLVIANRFARGFPFTDDFRWCCHHVEDFFAGHVKWRDYEFGTYSLSWRDGNNELMFRINCGDDAHLGALNTPKKMEFTANMLGRNVYKSLMLLPLDLDAVAKKVLEEDEFTTARLGKFDLTVADFGDDCRDIYKWETHDQLAPPGQA